MLKYYFTIILFIILLTMLSVPIHKVETMHKINALMNFNSCLRRVLFTQMRSRKILMLFIYSVFWLNFS